MQATALTGPDMVRDPEAMSYVDLLGFGRHEADLVAVQPGHAGVTQEVGGDVGVVGLLVVDTAEEHRVVADRSEAFRDEGGAGGVQLGAGEGGDGDAGVLGVQGEVKVSVGCDRA